MKKNIIKAILFLFLSGFGTEIFSQNFFTLTITNNLNCDTEVEIFGSGGVSLGTFTAAQNTTVTFTCQTGKPGNIVFTSAGCASFQIPVNQFPVQCDTYGCSSPCCITSNNVESNMNSTATTPPGTCNNGIGFYWTLNLIFG